MQFDRVKEDLTNAQTLDTSTAGGILFLQQKNNAIPTNTWLLGHPSVSGSLTSVNPPQISYITGQNGNITKTNNLSDFLNQVSEGKNIAGIILVGSKEGGHYLGVNYDHKKSKLIITDPLGEENKISDSYKEYADEIIVAFNNHLIKNVTVTLNPIGTIYQGTTAGTDVISCGIASNINVAQFSNEEEKLSEALKKKLGITGNRLETNAEKARTFFKTAFDKDDEEEEKKHGARDSFGASKAITALWQQRDEELKKILTRDGYQITITDDKGKKNTEPTADELIKHYNILKDTTDKAKEVRKEIYNYDKDFGTKLAAAMEKAVKADQGQELDFKKEELIIQTGGRDLKLDVKIDRSGRKEIKIMPDTFKEGDNFTMSLAFQDEKGDNMPLDGALYYQIKVENGKITSISAPELKQENPPAGPYHAVGPRGNKVYPKLDIQTLEWMQEIKIELTSKDIIVEQSLSANIPTTPLERQNGDGNTATLVNNPRNPSSLEGGGLSKPRTYMDMQRENDFVDQRALNQGIEKVVERYKNDYGFAGTHALEKQPSILLTNKEKPSSNRNSLKSTKNKSGNSLNW